MARIRWVFGTNNKHKADALLRHIEIPLEKVEEKGEEREEVDSEDQIQK